MCCLVVIEVLGGGGGDALKGGKLGNGKKGGNRGNSNAGTGGGGVKGKMVGRVEAKWGLEMVRRVVVVVRWWWSWNIWILEVEVKVVYSKISTKPCFLQFL